MRGTSVWPYPLKPQHEIARVAVTQHARAARVGREVAADLAASLGRERQRKEPPVAIGRLLQRLLASGHTDLDPRRLLEV